METNERILARHYRANERTIKARTRYYARKWNVPADEISGNAREAFIQAVADYVPSFGASVDTLVAKYVNTALNQAAEKTKLLRNRFIPLSRMTCVNSEGESVEMEIQPVDIRLDKKPAASDDRQVNRMRYVRKDNIGDLEKIDLNKLQNQIDPLDKEDMELTKWFSDRISNNGKTLLQARLCGYTTAETIKAKLLTRHQAMKATNDLRAFALREFPNCVK